MTKLIQFILTAAMILSTQPALGANSVMGVSCNQVSCNGVPSAPAKIQLTGYGLGQWYGFGLNMSLNNGTGPVASMTVTVQSDGILYTLIDASALAPGYYTFAIYPSSSPTVGVATGGFSVLSDGSTSPSMPAATGGSSIAGTWVSAGMLVSTPLQINPNGTYNFGGSTGTYQMTASGPVFSGSLASVNGGHAALDSNGVLHFASSGPSTYSSLWYTFRRI